MPDDQYEQVLSLPFETEKQKRFLFLLFAVFFELFLAIIYYKFGNPYSILGIFILTGILFRIAFSIRNTLILLFAYISLLPSVRWVNYYFFWHGLHYSTGILSILILLVFLWTLCDINKKNNIFNKPFSVSDLLLSFFLIYTIISGLRGYFENADFYVIKVEMFFMLCYVFYFIYTKKLKLSQLKQLNFILILLTIIVAFEYILIAFTEINLSKLIFTRVVSRQAHLAQIVIPLLGGYVLFSKNKTHKYLATAALFPLFAMALLSQQRGLWAGILVSIVLLSAFFTFKDKISFIKFFRFLFVILIIVLILFGTIFLLDFFTKGSITITFLSRITGFMDIGGDVSMNMRMLGIRRVMNQWQDSWINILFGTGLGAAKKRIAYNDTYPFIVDNSYVFLLWKMGIVGLLSYLSLFFLFFKKGLYVFFHTTKVESKQLSSALMAGVAGLLVVGLSNTCLLLYRFIIIWALAIATIELLYRQEKRDVLNLNNI